MFKTEGGITLVALVITIIVMLILAGVSISLVLDENNGVIRRAQVSVNAYEQGRIREIDQLTEFETKVDKLIEHIDSIYPSSNSLAGQVSSGVHPISDEKTATSH